MGSPDTGTTIIAVKFSEGVIIGCDGRVTIGTYIDKGTSAKI